MKITNRIKSLLKPQLNSKTKMSNIKKKRLLVLTENSWNLVKLYAAYKKYTINEALESIIKDKLTKFKGALDALE